MPLMGLQYGPRALPWTEALQLAQEDANFAYPVPLVRAMMDQRSDEVPSASVIAGCLRQFTLKRRVPYYEKPASMLAPLMGTAFHAWMEKYTEVDAPELEDFTAGGGYTMTKGGPRHKELLLRATLDLGLEGYHAVPVLGRCDYLHEGEVLADWKKKGYIPVGFKPPREHQTQLNIYNWLASKEAYQPAKRWELRYVSEAWAVRFTRPMKPLEAVEDYIKERLTIWASAESSGRLPAPVPAFFEDGPKGKGAFPCSHCPVAEACREAFRAETEAPF